MDLRQLRQFSVLARTLNFHRAAEQLNMAQPPLSVSIAKLEAELGVRLFERHPRGVRLTMAGEAGLPLAEAALTRTEELREAVGAVALGRRGQLRLGFVSSATYGLAPRVVAAFQRAFPDVELVLREATSVEVLAQVQDKTLDIGIVRTPLLEPTPLSLTELEIDQLALVTSADHRLGHERIAHLEDLKAEGFVMYDRSAVPNMRTLVVLACEAAGFLPRITQSAAQIHTVLALVEQGLGIALAPARLATGAPSRLRFVPLLQRGRPIAVGLALAERPGESSRLIANLRALALNQLEDNP
jgi:DNA-binding transcriptional LysR family regulator